MGGHPTFDPFAALAFCAAVTSRIVVMSYITVLPYRHPMLIRKSMATVSRLAAERFVMVVGSGYLRSEFYALGVDFADRGSTTDRALDLITQPFDRDMPVSADNGNEWGVACEPPPRSRPDVWVAGTGDVAMRRVVRFGQGWDPLIQDETAAATTRSSRLLRTPEDLGRGVSELHEMLREAGRDPEEIAIHSDAQLTVTDALEDPSRHAAMLERLRRAGATHVLVRVDTMEVSEAGDAIAAYGREFVPS